MRILLVLFVVGLICYVATLMLRLYQVGKQSPKPMPPERTIIFERPNADPPQIALEMSEHSKFITDHDLRCQIYIHDGHRLTLQFATVRDACFFKLRFPS